VRPSPGQLPRRSRPGPPHVYVVSRPSMEEVISERYLGDESARIAIGVPNCTVFAVCFSRPWVPTRLKLRVRSAKPLESQRSRSRFRSRNAQKQATQNTVGKKRPGQEDWIPTTSLVGHASPCGSEPHYEMAKGFGKRPEEIHA